MQPEIKSTQQKQSNVFSSNFTPAPHSSLRLIEENDGLPTDNVGILTYNICLYIRLATHSPKAPELPIFRTQLQSQIDDLFSDKSLPMIGQNEMKVFNLAQLKVFRAEEEEKVKEIGRTLRDMAGLMKITQSPKTKQECQSQIQGCIGQLQDIIRKVSDKEATVEEVQIAKQCPDGHFLTEAILTNVLYPLKVYRSIQPLHHARYIHQAASNWHQIAPIRLRYLAKDLTTNESNYFHQEKGFLAYCIPNTNKIGYYRLSELTKSSTFGKDQYRQWQLQSKMSQSTNITITPKGSIYAVNIKQTKYQPDDRFYQIVGQKIVSLGQLPQISFDSQLFSISEGIYLLGGRNQQGQAVSSVHRYSISSKKWSKIPNCPSALLNSTLITFQKRYLIKLWGVNRFGAVSKQIWVLDTTKGRWSPLGVTHLGQQPIQGREDVVGVQISPFQVFIFGGKFHTWSNKTTYLITISPSASGLEATLQTIHLHSKDALGMAGCLVTQPYIHENQLYALRVHQ